MNSLDTLKAVGLPKKGVDRYFVFLVNLQSKLNINFQLSDLELSKLAKKLNRICK